MPFWTVVGLFLAAWLVVAVVAGLAIGAVIRRRDRQIASDHLPGKAEPDEGA